MSGKWYTPAGKSYNFHMDVLEQAHVLVAGATSSGKSVILNGLIYHALYKAPQDAPGCCQLILCDPKRVELAKFKNLPHVLRFANTLETIADALRYADAIMMQRYADMERRGLVMYDGGDIYVIVDEFADLITKTPDKALNHTKSVCEAEIEAIGRLGRAARVHLILATQSPDRKTIKAHIQQNMVAKIALRCDTAIESRQVIGVKGAEDIEQYGELYYKRPGHRDPEHYINIPMFDDATLQERVSWWTDQTRPTPPRFLRRIWPKQEYKIQLTL